MAATLSRPSLSDVGRRRAARERVAGGRRLGRWSRLRRVRGLSFDVDPTAVGDAPGAVAHDGCVALSSPVAGHDCDGQRKIQNTRPAAVLATVAMVVSVVSLRRMASTQSSPVPATMLA